ncbi:MULTISPECIES: MFS transporter [Paraburkholderia]|jgi:MFS family permease|uniref:MFS transporter n=1 Tax=Paraburkholderia largidicola TaxID=3014751 RepID=A0A7I8BIX4_9BURK|nr:MULTISPECIES: MFS transporter [Paraburkholderia]BCF88425.1 MFS transporter [Paraburkholderia sp. PGU16]BEU21457.1 MFS transporter [Paraburkholderia sp. 22B1P]GJG99969.1 MFS transporter [Paraburkholderia terrae]CAG9257387.1 putative sulfoacetate transporter SauU [Paraburkholderia caribensis]
MPHRPRVTRSVLALMCAMSFIMYLDRVNLSAAAGLIRDDLHLSNTNVGFVFGAFAYTYAIFQVIGGWFSDRVGAKTTLMLCATIWIIATVATGVAGGVASLFCARMLLGVGEGAALPAQARALVNWYPASKRGFVQGLTHSFSRLGNALTPPLIALLVAFASWRASFLLVGALTAVWLVVYAWYFKDDPRKHRHITREEVAELPPETMVSAKTTREPTPWGRLIRRIGPTMIVYFCYGWTGWLFFTWLPTFFMHGRGLDLKSSALFSAGVFLSGVVGNTAGGMLSDRILKRTGNVVAARRNMIIVAFLGALVFLAPVMIVDSLPVMAASLSLSFFFLELTIGPIWAVPMDITPKHVGIASGLVNAGSAIAGIFSPIAFGFIVDRTGNWTLPFIGSLGLLTVGIVMTFFMRPDIKLDAQPDDASGEHGLKLAEQSR